jgi:hypothetical protein
MLRISIAETPNGATVALDGRLAGPWVGELARCLENMTAAGSPGSIQVRLDEVTFIDHAGRALLQAIHGRGVTLAAAGCMTRAIIEEITDVRRS